MITIAVQQPVPIPQRELVGIERAVTDQLNHGVRAAWHTPKVRFVNSTATGGQWPLTFEPMSQVESEAGTGAEAYHDWSTQDGVTYTPYLVIGTTTSKVLESVLVSHEAIEATVDAKTGLIEEAADAVETVGYRVDGWVVSDFVFPSWFTPGAHGPWDKLQVTRHAGDAWYGYDPGAPVAAPGSPGWLGGARRVPRPDPVVSTRHGGAA